ncbi:MAG: hypothetical protein KGZ86_04435 [Candidatus Latescibacteria bacterium]|nr:hypothetical protein [Candidatus Latescibacterota bacterium]
MVSYLTSSLLGYQSGHDSPVRRVIRPITWGILIMMTCPIADKIADYTEH